MNHKFSILSLIAILAFSSCIPQRKYNELKMSYDDILTQIATYKTDSRNLQTDVSSLNSQIESLYNNIAQLKEDTAFLGGRLRKVESSTEEFGAELDDRNKQLETSIKDREALSMELENKRQELNRKEQQLDDRNKELQSKQEAFTLQQAEAETLKKQLTEQQKAVEAKEKLLTEQQASMSSKDADIASLNTNLADREAKVQELEGMIDAQTTAVSELEGKINSALTDFNTSELVVTRKNGKVYVSLQEKLLFQSGSTTIDSKGKEAIGQIASVLKSNADVEVSIEGHTDNVPYNGSGKVKDNWDLSVLRATSVVRILVQDYGIPASRILASGKGEHDPVSDNASADGKKQNRRIEIILSPNLDELFELLESK